MRTLRFLITFMLVLILYGVAARSKVSIGFCEQSKCNFPSSFSCLVVDPFTIPISKSIPEIVARYIEDATDVDIYFNVKGTSYIRFSFPLNIFIFKNLSIKKLYGQRAPDSIVFTISNHDDYSKTEVYIENILIKFELNGFNSISNKLNFDEFVYTTENASEFSIFTKNEKYIEISCNKIQFCDVVMFNFNAITLLDPSNNFVTHVRKKITAEFFINQIIISDDTDQLSIFHKSEQNISFEGIDYQSKLLITSSDNIDSIQQLPYINISGIFDISIDGDWPDADIDDVNNFIYIPRKNKLDLNGKIIINSTNVPFNIFSKISNLYFSIEYSKICGNIISDSKTNLYIDFEKEIKILLEIVRHEKGKILIFHSNFTVTIDCIQFDFGNESTFPVIIAFSNTEIAHVIISDVEFNQISEVVKYLSLINIMDRNPKGDMDFILDGDNPFLVIPRISFFYFVDLSVIYNEYSNLVHGFKNGINCLEINYYVNYEDDTVEISSFGEPPMYIPLVFCIAEDEDDCEEIGSYYYFVDDSESLYNFYYVSQEFMFYNVHVFSSEITKIGLTGLESMFYSFQFFLHGAKISLSLPDDETILYNLTIIDGIIVTDADFACTSLVLSEVSFPDSINVTFNCRRVQSDIPSLSLVLHTRYIGNLFIIDYKDFSYIIDITDDDFIIDGVIIPWVILDYLSIYGFEFILNNKATNITGFDITAVAEDTVVQFNGDYKELVIQDSISIIAEDFSAVIYVYQPYLNPKIVFQLGDRFQYILSYLDTVSYCIYFHNDSNDSVCPKTYVKRSYLDLDSCADTNATRIEIYFNNKPETTTFASIDLNLFNSKELYFFCSSDLIIINVTLPNDDIDLEFTSVTIQNLLIYVKYEYEGQQINTTFGYLTLMASKFMNAENVSVAIDHFYGRFANIMDWKDMTINKKCYLYDSNTEMPYSLNFVPQSSMMNRLNLYLKDTNNDRLIIIGDRRMYFNNGVFNLPFDYDFEIYIFVTDPHHKIEFRCNETGRIPNLNIIFNSEGPLYFTGIWDKNDGYLINLTIDRYTQILIEYRISMNIFGTGSPTILCGTVSCAILGNIVLTVPEDEYQNVLGVDSLYRGIVAKLFIQSLKYKFQRDYDAVFTAVIMLGTSVDLTILELGYEGVKQNGYDFVYYMDNFGVSQVTILDHIDGMKLSDEIILFLNLTGNLDNEEDYQILRENIPILTATSDDTYFDIDLYIMMDDNSLIHGFSQIIKLDKINQIRIGYSNFYLYSKKSPLDIPYTVQFAIDNVFYPNIDVGIYMYQKIDTAFDSVPFKIRQIEFIISSVIPINYPIKVSALDSKYNTAFHITTTMNEMITIYIDEPGAGVNKLMIENIRLKKQTEADSLFSSIKSLWMNDAEIGDNALNGLKDIPFLNADIESFSKLIDSVTFSGVTEATVRNMTAVVFGEDFWYIKPENNTKKYNRVDAKQFKSMTIEASNDINLQIFDEFNQTSISGLNISFISTSGLLEYCVTFGDRWKRILDMSVLSISSKNPINVFTMSMPLNFHVTAPSKKIEFDPKSKERFQISDAVISESFEMDLSRFPRYQQIVTADTITISNKVEITFKGNIGQIVSANLTILPGSSVSIQNISVSNIISISPGSTLNIEKLVTKNDTSVELHWSSVSFPLLSFNHTVAFNNISLILDDEKPNIDIMNALLFNKQIIIMSGNFDCEKWQWKLKMMSSSSYYRSGNENVLALQCKRENFKWKLFLSSYQNVTIESTVHQTPKGVSIGYIAGFTVAALFVVGILSISFYYICRDSRKVRLREQRREIRENIEKKEKALLSKPQKEIMKAASSSYNDFTSFSLSESSETEDNDKAKRYI